MVNHRRTKGHAIENLATRLKWVAENRPEKVFCTFLSGGSAEEITFAALYERSRHYAGVLARMGVGRGDVVLIILQHSPHLFYAFLGAILAGAIPSFMPFPSAKQRADLYWHHHDVLFRRIEPALIVTYRENGEALRRFIPESRIPVLIADDALLQGELPLDDDLPGLRADPAGTACLQHSSGTTSLKKGVMLSHGIILRQTETYAGMLAFGATDSIASWLPLYHDMGFIACFMMSVMRGTHLVALDPFEWVLRPAILLDAIERYRTSFCWLPNFAFTHIANLANPKANWDLSSMRAFINCSEPCKPVTFSRFVERFAGDGVRFDRLQVCYAMAENVFGVTQTGIGAIARVLPVDAAAFARGEIRETPATEKTLQLISCGPALPGVGVEIVGEDGTTLPNGRIGEIRLAGNFLFDGYYRLPEQTRAKLRDGWYYTNDMGFILDGELYVTGRKDDLLIINGRNYYAHEIEAIVNAVPGITPGRNIAIAVDNRATDASVVVILAECQAGVNAGQLRKDIFREVQTTLDLTIHSVVPLAPGSLIKTTSGKISRAENKRLYLAGNLQKSA